MKTYVKWAALAPILVVVLIFAVVNRQEVRIVFDPFDSADAAMSVAAPLFLALFISAIVGVLLGGFVTWLGQSKHRRAARTSGVEASRLRADNERLRAAAATGLPAPDHNTAA